MAVPGWQKDVPVPALPAQSLAQRDLPREQPWPFTQREARPGPAGPWLHKIRAESGAGELVSLLKNKCSHS